MTPEEFDQAEFHKGMVIEYEKLTLKIIAVDFNERLIALDKPYDMEPLWVRHENCKIVDNG